MANNITLKHFIPYSIWAEEKDGSKYSDGTAQNIIDTHTGDKYFNEDRGVIWFKCALLTIGTPVVHLVAAVATIAANLLRLLSFYHFWKSVDAENGHYNFTSRLLDAGGNLAHMVFAPLAIALLELAAIIGLLAPRDGRKLYASTERLAYGHFVLAPCFQPEATEHFFGGDVNQRNAY